MKRMRMMRLAATVLAVLALAACASPEEWAASNPERQASHSAAELHPLLVGKVWVFEYPGLRNPPSAYYFGRDGRVYMCISQNNQGRFRYAEGANSWTTVDEPWVRTLLVMNSNGTGPSPFLDEETGRLYTRAKENGQSIIWADGFLQDHWPDFADEHCPQISNEVRQLIGG